MRILPSDVVNVWLRWLSVVIFITSFFISKRLLKLPKTAYLGRSIRYKVGKGQAVVYSDAVYAKIHNEGGEIPVTAKMKKYFWAMYYQTKGKTVGRTKKQRDILTKQAKFYRAMALKKIGSAIKIPKRHFLGKSPKLEAELKKLITKHLSGIIKH